MTRECSRFQTLFCVVSLFSRCKITNATLFFIQCWNGCRASSPECSKCRWSRFFRYCQSYVDLLTYYSIINDSIEWVTSVRRWNSTSAEEDARFQRLFPNPSWLTSGRTPGRQKLITTFQRIDIDIRQTLKAGCLPHAVEKQLFIPLINLGRKWLLKWWWWLSRQSTAVSWEHKGDPSLMNENNKYFDCTQMDLLRFLSTFAIQGSTAFCVWQQGVRCNLIITRSFKGSIQYMMSLCSTFRLLFLKVTRRTQNCVENVP